MSTFTKNSKLSIQNRVKKRLELLLEKKSKIITFLALGILLGLIITLLLPKRYRATSSLSLEFNSYNNELLKNSGNLDNIISLVNSTEFLNKEKKIIDKKGHEITVSELTESREISTNNLGASISVTAVSNNPQKTADIANSTAKMIQENCVLNSYSILLNGLNVVTNRANILTKNIQNSLRNNQSGSFDSRTEMLLSQIAEFESELESVDIETQYYSFKLNELKEAFGKLYPGKSEQVLEFFNDEFAKTKTKLERIKVKEFLSNLERQARVIRIQYPWQGYSINDLASVTGVLSKQIENYIDKNVNTDNIVDVEFFYDLAQTIHITQANINAIDISKNVIFTTLTKLENEFNRIPYQEIDKARVIRTTKFNNSLNTKLALKKQKLLSKENEYYPKVNSVTTALVPTSYFSPNIGLNIFIGALLGSLIGIFLALSSTSDKIEEITSADDLVDFGYKIVAKIPTFPIGAPVLLDTMKENEKATIGKNLTAPFENIETFLRYGNLDKTLKTILVTSGQNEEGKSLIATNIAITLANKGNKVILVDTDVINPQQHKNFKIKATPSLAHYLFRKKELDEIIKNTYNQNLDIITSIEIPQNPSVILSSERMKNFMDHVKESYDFIVYDSCSLTEINEVAVLANNIDEVLLLIRAGKSKIPDVLETEKILKRNGISRFNVILNEIES